MNKFVFIFDNNLNSMKMKNIIKILSFLFPKFLFPFVREWKLGGDIEDEVSGRKPNFLEMFCVMNVGLVSDLGPGPPGIWGL